MAAFLAKKDVSGKTEACVQNGQVEPTHAFWIVMADFAISTEESVYNL